MLTKYIDKKLTIVFRDTYTRPTQNQEGRMSRLAKLFALAALAAVPLFVAGGTKAQAQDYYADCSYSYPYTCLGTYTADGYAVSGYDGAYGDYGAGPGYGAGGYGDDGAAALAVGLGVGVGLGLEYGGSGGYGSYGPGVIAHS